MSTTYTTKLYVTPFKFTHSTEVSWIVSQTSRYEAGKHGALADSVERTVTLDVPTFDVTAAEVAALNAQKAQALAAYQKTVAELNERLSKLLAITNEVEA